MEEALNRLISLVQEAAPEVWRIAMRRVLADTIETGIWLFAALILLALCVFLFFPMGKNMFMKSDNQDEDFIGVMIAGVAIVGIILSAFWTIEGSIKLANMLVAPEYYALQHLTNLVK